MDAISEPATAGVNGQVLTTEGSGGVSWQDASGGSVTSVGLTVPTGFSVSNSPITTAGNIAYSTGNNPRNVEALAGANNVKSVSFYRDDNNNNTVIIIRPQDGVPANFSYGKVNISNFYHSVSHNEDLAVKSNYKVEAVLESSLTGLTPYTAGGGLDLTDNTFSVKYGTNQW